MIHWLFQKRMSVVELSLLVLILIFGSLVFVHYYQKQQAHQLETHRVLIYTVHSGDTLWGVTERAVACQAILCPSGDLREAIQLVSEINQRYRTTELHPGDRLAVPITNPAAPPETAIQTALEATHWGEVHLDPNLFPSLKI